jgi:ABC-type sugar transport system substrate-binding protein
MPSARPRAPNGRSSIRLLRANGSTACCRRPHPAARDNHPLRPRRAADRLPRPRHRLDSSRSCRSTTTRCDSRPSTFGLGHERIAHIAGAPGLRISEDRIEGYRDAHRRAGAPPDPALLAVGSFTEEGGYDATRSLLATQAFTAVFAANDLSALGVLGALAESGLRVPAEISVVEFDDLRLSRFTTPPLTTVHQPAAEIARLATTLLLELAEGRTAGQMLHLLEPALVVRSSTAAPA